jgi:hypothetical protein
VKLFGIGVTLGIVICLAIVVLAEMTVMVQSENIYENTKWDLRIVPVLLAPGDVINIIHVSK